jgi:hypothetical protein
MPSIAKFDGKIQPTGCTSLGMASRGDDLWAPLGLEVALEIRRPDPVSSWLRAASGDGCFMTVRR